MKAAPHNPPMPDVLRPFRTAWDGFVAANARRGFLWLPVWFGCGMAVYFSLGQEPDWRVAALLVAGCAFAVYAARRMGGAGVAYALTALLFFWAGFGIATIRTAQVGAYLLSEAAGPLMLEGVVRSVVMRDEKRTSAILDKVWMERTKAARTPSSIKLTGYHIPRDTAPGTKIRVLAKLMPPSSPIVPGGYDFRLKAYFDGIGATGYTLGEVQILATPHGGGTGLHFFERLRTTIGRRIEAAQRAQDAAVSKALMTGDRAAIGKDVMDDIRAAGLAHLLSISGLHISLFAGGVFFALRLLMALWPRLALRYPIKKFAAVGGIGAALFYMMLAGATVPTQRATIMAVIVFLAVILDRKAISLRLVAIAALAVLAWRPEAVLNPGFQMSFAAVMALVAFYEWFANRPRGEEAQNRSIWTIGRAYFAGIALTSLVAGAATMIYAVYHFGVINPYAVAGNMFALPVMSAVIMPCAILGLLSFSVAPVSEFFFRLMGAGVDWILAASARIADWPLAVYEPPVMPAAAMVALSLGLLSACLLGKGRGKILAVCLCWGAAIAIWGLAPRLVLQVHDAPLSVSWRGQDGEAQYMPRAPSRFIRDASRRYLAKMPHDATASGAGGMRCDAFGCQWLIAMQKVVFLHDPVVLAQECASGGEAIVFVRQSVGALQKQACQKGGVMVYDFDDMRRNGAHGVFHGPLYRGVRVKYAATGQNRPWGKE